ncbi:MAG: hypothetical protein VW644_00450 [Alphaproteobacteria bacterium]|jgi:hypothetical protein
MNAYAAGPGAAMADLADRCTAAHGYDPRKPGEISENELAEGERAWRDCMYAGIDADIAHRSSSPAEWRALIDADRQMTDAIAAGSMTRSQRAARLQMLIANIRMAELTAADRRVREAQRNLELQDEIERIRRAVPRFF